MGGLYPIYCRNDILPGDKFQLSAAPFIRFMPLVSPSLTNVDVEVRYFFVPYRLLWDKWKPYISPNTSEQVNLMEPYVPSSVVNNAANPTATYIFNVAGSIFDYMGCASFNWSNTNANFGGQNWHGFSDNDNHFGSAAPFKAISNLIYDPRNVNAAKYSAYPFLAYNFIWNEYFRDENLDPEATYTILPGQSIIVAPHNCFIRRVNWNKDYFSSALPFVTQQIYGNVPTVQNGMTIESLREASALTKWLELQAVGGHRYQESILTHFGVRVPDEASQIPIYLGGGKCPVQIGSVEQTVPFNGEANKMPSSPLANLGGKGTASDSMFVDKFEFKEHGVLLGLMYVRPTALYADVTSKDLFRKESRHDYYWPDFANLGDEAISTNELNPGFNFAHPDDFGYQMRYASYRTSFDRVHGQLRPLEPLESWTQARSWSDYNSENLAGMVSPYLNESFIKCKPSNRIFADTSDEDTLVGEITTFVDAVRPMPNYVDPKLD